MPILIAPVLEIAPVAFDVPGSPRFVVLTSAHAAAAAGGQPALAGLVAYCVGDRTAEAAAAAGLRPVSAQGSAEALARLLRETRPAGPGLYLRGRHAAADLVEELAGDGIELTARVAYDQVAQPLSAEALAALEGPGPVILPLYSPRSARLLAEACAGRPARIEAVAISPQTAAAWRAPEEIGAVAAAPEGPAMERAIVARALARSAC